MNKPAKFAIVAGLIVVVGAVLAAKQSGRKQAAAPCCPAVIALTDTANLTADTTSVPVATKKLPRIVDVGAGKCIPCKMMAPILEELKTTYNGKLQVDFIDVWKKPDEANKYKISIIPTQIFYDASGKELFRHEGFFVKEDIIAKWKEFGVDLGGQK